MCMPGTQVTDGYELSVTEPRSSARATCVLNCQAVSLAPKANFLINEGTVQRLQLGLGMK